MLEKNTATLLPRIAAKLIIALPHRAFPILRVFLRRAAHPGTAAAFTAAARQRRTVQYACIDRCAPDAAAAQLCARHQSGQWQIGCGEDQSEERRVGKECRSRW